MTLLTLLTPRTRLVAFTATSNILGAFTPVKQAVELVREKTNGRAMTVVDCVASAPHGRMDMKEWGVDVVLFSYYKVRRASRNEFLFVTQRKAHPSNPHRPALRTTSLLPNRIPILSTVHSGHSVPRSLLPPSDTVLQARPRWSALRAPSGLRRGVTLPPNPRVLHRSGRRRTVRSEPRV
jgi:hypothetical protein